MTEPYPAPDPLPPPDPTEPVEDGVTSAPTEAAEVPEGYSTYTGAPYEANPVKLPEPHVPVAAPKDEDAPAV